jgi:hypothetical protein
MQPLSGAEFLQLVVYILTSFETFIFFPVQELATNLEDIKNELKVTKKKNAAHLKVYDLHFTV